MSNDQLITSLVRSDRMGIRSRTGVGARSWGWLATSVSYGDLWLTESGEMGFAKVKWYDQDWRTHISDVTVREIPKEAAYRTGVGMYYDRSLEISFGPNRYLVVFTGIVHFRSTADKLIAKVPGVHHAGAMIVEAKSLYKNRGTKERAIEAMHSWREILTATGDEISRPISDLR
jgi:hypothetical protein